MAATVYPATGSCSINPVMQSLPTAFPEFGLTPEQRHEAVFGHYYERPGMDGERGEIWCYAPALPTRPARRSRCMSARPPANFRLDIVRDGGSRNTGADNRQRGRRAGRTRRTSARSTAAAGTQRFEFRVADEWPSGAYRITRPPRVVTANRYRSHHLIIVRPAAGRRKAGRILQVAATGTWAAYNTWGGSNHYQGITGPNRDQYAPVVGIERPLVRGFVRLPPEAPRVPLEIALPPLTAPRYPHMEWAYATGHSKKYTSSGWASYDSHFFRWAERAGYAVDLASQHELHFEPEILDGYDCVVFVGHDEYWTWEMRDAVDAYVERGGHVGPLCRQFHVADAGSRTRSRARSATSTAPAPRTRPIAAAMSAAPPIPGRRRRSAGRARSTFGLNATAASMPAGAAARRAACAAFPIYRPEHWAFAGTGLYYGDVLGADSHVFGYEVDGLDYVIRNGLPEPTPRGRRAGRPADPGARHGLAGRGERRPAGRDVPQ